ncbi:MAG: TonB-dependent receptor [Candidatus Aminicenantes bacterium]|nr:TonB-dependent receptor [Candidatus Aminicenantes bacterium]
MRKNASQGFLVLLLILGFIASGFAQGQTGSLSGKVVDGQKIPLPGVAILISGPSLLGTNTCLTGPGGGFRFPFLLPGTYELRVEMPGFATQLRPGLVVALGRTTEIVIALEESEAEKEVTVAAPSPALDVRASKSAVNYGTALLAAVPWNRDLEAVQNSVPGAVPEGSSPRRAASILGGSVRGQLYALDGAPLGDPDSRYAMVNINTDVYDEVEFMTGGLPAEVGQTDGTYVNIVSKSGGNAYFGTLTGYYTGDGLSTDLWTSEQLAELGVNPPEQFSDSIDLSLSAGGPVLTDSLWFFLNGRRLAWKRLNPGNAEMRMAELGFMDSLHYDADHREWLAFAKLSFQATREIRYAGLFHFNNVYEPVALDSIAGNADLSYTRILDNENAYTTTHQVNWLLNPETFLDFRGSYIWRRRPLLARALGEYSHYDETRDVWWGSAGVNDERIQKRYAASVSATIFRDGFLGADHEFKAGLEFEQSENHRDWYTANPYTASWKDYASGDLYSVSSELRRGYLHVLTAPGAPGVWDIQDQTRRFSGFLQDSLRAGRLAVNFGVRLDYSLLFEPEQGRPSIRYAVAPPGANPEWAEENPNALLEALISDYKKKIGPVSPWDSLRASQKNVVDFVTLSPRLGVVYDLTGDGRTAARLSLARYYEPFWAAKYAASRIFGAGPVRWTWTDTNGNGLLDLPPIDDYLFDASFANPSQDPKKNSYPADLKPPRTDELIIGLERELLRDFRVGLEFLYRRSSLLIEDADIVNGYDPNAVDENGKPVWLPFVFTDPGPDNVWGTSDDKQMTAYGLRADRPPSEYLSGNPPEAKRRYLAAVLSFSKRLSRKWQLAGSLVASSFVGNVDAGEDGTTGQSSLCNNPNAMINAYGPLGADRPLQVKLMGSYILPLDFMVSAFFQYSSGTPWNRTLRVSFPAGFGAEYGGVTPASIVLNAEEPGSNRTPSYADLDLRLEKRLALKTFSLDVFLDVFNVTGRTAKFGNDDPAPRLRYDLAAPVIETRPGYGDVTAVSGVRSFRLGVRINF